MPRPFGPGILEVGMASYEEHERAAVDLLAPLRGQNMQPEYRLKMAQVEALLALAAAIALRPAGGSPGQSPAR
jgi:hypothetical protein